MLRCGSVRLDCRKRGRARPVNPLKLGHTLSTLNFGTCDHEDTLFFCVCSFSTSFFDDCKFHNFSFVGFLRRSTNWKEVADRNIYPQQDLLTSGPQHREASLLSPTDSLITIPIAEYTVNSPLKIKQLWSEAGYSN